MGFQNIGNDLEASTDRGKTLSDEGRAEQRGSGLCQIVEKGNEFVRTGFARSPNARIEIAPVVAVHLKIAKARRQ